MDMGSSILCIKGENLRIYYKEEDNFVAIFWVNNNQIYMS